MHISTLNRSQLLAATLLLTLAAAQPLRALAEASPAVPNAAESNDAYAIGTKALNEQRWADAVKSFDSVIDAKGKRVDAALYWKAYALQKTNQGPLALATCYQLRAQYTASAWNKDCTALTIALQQPGIAPVPPLAINDPSSQSGYGNGRSTDPDTDLKILALNSLLHQDPARAMPILRSILTGDRPASLKKQAIFVLAQSKAPEAEAILHDAVTGKLNPELQRQAIQMMAVFQGKRANDTLIEVYRSTSDTRIKKSVITAIFITQDGPRMVELARAEKDLDLKRSIVSQLALMNDKAATDYMLELLK